MQTAWKLGVVALIALAFTAIPGGGSALNVLLTLLMVAFFVAIAIFGHRLYREHRFTIETIPDRHRATLYGAIGLAFLTFVATPQLFAIPAGWVIWIALLAVASYGVFWVLVRARRAL